MAQRISFDNKVDLVTSAAARINKSTAADWNDVKSVVNSHADNIEALNGGSGWALYADSEHTSESPLVVEEGQTVQLTNNANTVIDTYLPNGVTSFYDNVSDRVYAQSVGDAYIIRISFEAETNNNNGYAEINFNIGVSEGQNIILTKDINFPRGTGSVRAFTSSSVVYSLDAFVANGCAFEIRSITGETSIFNINFMIARIHKAG